MRRLLRGVRYWWSHRTVQFRTTAVATAVALIGLGVMARVSAGVIGWLLLGSIDTELRDRTSTVAQQVVTGRPPEALERTWVRILDTAGEPVDGGGSFELSPWQLGELKSGDGIIDRPEYEEARRWSGRVVPDPEGQPRLVLAGASLVGYTETLSVAGRALGLASVAGAATVGLATWIVVRRSLRPVERMRVAAGSLPEGERLPLPEAKDELRALAEALNEMLAGRDADTEWLRRFTGDAAHELRNPVASIRAQAEVAVVHPDPELVQETLQDITTEAQRLSDLVDGLLALARAESGSQPEPRPVDLTNAARAVADRWNMRDTPRRVHTELPGGSIVILASPAEVATILDNLVGNAQRYARALVRISVLPAARFVRLLVDDDGPGIPVEHRERVFDRFHRVQADRARSTGGSGLGLALVAEAVRRRGGSVKTTESPDGGARIEVRWPLPGPLPPAGR